MVNDSNEQPPRGLPGFEIVGATPEEEHQLIMTLCYLPKSHLKAVRTLAVFNESEWESLIVDGFKKAAGFAGTNIQGVVLVRERCKDKLMYYALHETAHMVWQNCLTEDERQDFLGMIEWVRGGELVAITWYAEIGGFDEHFAEAYVNYVLSPRYLRRKEPDVYRWLKNYVFHGETYLGLEQKLKGSKS